MKEYIIEWMKQLLIHFGMDPGTADRVNQFAIFATILLLAVIVDLICRFVVVKIVRRVVAHTKTTLDDILFQPSILNKLAHMIPVILFYILIPLAFSDGSDTLEVIRRICVVYLIVMVLIFLNTLIDVMFEFFNRKKTLRDRPIKGTFQIAQVVLWLIGVIIILAVLFDKSPAKLFAGLGASAAILMLVFRDSILGFVSGIQLSANNMVRKGDWITVPNYGADGTVIDITMNTVKVQNFDNTITMLPPYALVSGYFQNWRGMMDSGGRRIMRSISIDINSVKFCTPEMLDKYRKIDLIRSYIEEKEEELKKFNAENRIDDHVTVNRRRQTNVGVFRAYLQRYLNNLSVLNHDLTCMVRHLQPTELGLPIQIYCFSANKEWVAYEGIQADIFDHIMAIIPEFDLYVFQSPSGVDVRNLGASMRPAAPAGQMPEEKAAASL